MTKDNTGSLCLGSHIGTVFENEQELLKTVIRLHCPNGIDLDPMFFKGNFYKQIEEPKYIGDIEPRSEFVQKMDACELPFTDKSIKTMILDPPFMFGIHGKEGFHQKSYYSSSTHGIFKDFFELSKLYMKILWEAYRVLDKKGILIFKCQDYTDSGTTMTHCYVYNWAVELGFYAKDLAILYLPIGKVSNSETVQRHLRKHHSYFWVFEKRSKRN